MLWVILIVTGLSMLACYQIVNARSGDRVFWVLMALLFGPFAIPFAFFAKPQSESGSQAR